MEIHVYLEKRKMEWKKNILKKLEDLKNRYDVSKAIEIWKVWFYNSYSSYRKLNGSELQSYPIGITLKLK
jgi:hypothetical protein